MPITSEKCLLLKLQLLKAQSHDIKETEGKGSGREVYEWSIGEPAV